MFNICYGIPNIFTSKGLIMKILVGISGGVDSAVAAYLLKQQGHEVIGATMSIWGKNGVQKKNSRKNEQIKTKIYTWCLLRP